MSNQIEIYANTSWNGARQYVANEEKKDFLNCKYWKESKESAIYFGTYYSKINILHNLHLVAALLLGAENDKEFEKYISLSIKAFNANFKQDSVTRMPYEKDDAINNPKKFKYLKAILKEIFQISNKEMTPEELIDWAEENPIFSKKRINKARKKIKVFRKCPIFLNNATLDHTNVKYIKPIIENNLSLTYEDANTLFFPNDEIFEKLIQAINEKKISGYFPNKKHHASFFNSADLLKWLMKHNCLPEWLTHEFINLKTQSLIQQQTDPLNRFPEIKFKSLLDASKKGIEKDSVLQDGIKNKLPIFLRYPTEIKFMYHESVKCKKTDNLPDMRYKGFGQLYALDENESSSAGLYGNYTLERLFRCSDSENYFNNGKFGGGNAPHKIELLPTKEEAKYNLQPYIEVPLNKIRELISDKHLMILEDDAQRYLGIEYHQVNKGENNIMNDQINDTVQNYALGKNLREKRSQFAKVRGKESKAQAIKKFQYFKPEILDIAKSKKNISVSSLAAIAKKTIPNIPWKDRALRQHITEDPDIKPYIKLPNKNKQP